MLKRVLKVFPLISTWSAKPSKDEFYHPFYKYYYKKRVYVWYVVIKTVNFV